MNILYFLSYLLISLASRMTTVLIINSQTSNIQIYIYLCSLRLPGSRMIFINFVEPEKFTEIMEIIGFTFKRDTSASGGSQLYALPAPYQGIFIEHILGDAAEAEMLEPIVLNNPIHTAIVLGTQWLSSVLIESQCASAQS